MNLKVVIAFLLGIMAALGVVLVMKRESPEHPAAQTAPAQTAAVEPLAPTMAEPVVPGAPVTPPVKEPPPPLPPVAPKPAAKPAASKPTVRPAAGQPKPSPMPAATPKPAPEPAPRPAPEPVQEARNEPPPPAPPPAPVPVFKPDPPKERVPKTITIPSGTLVSVRLNEKVSSSGHTNGDAFSATMDQPLVVDGLVIAERGAKVEGVVVDATQSGRVKGRAALGLELKKFQSSDGQYVAIQTDTFRKEADSSTKGDAAKVGAAAGIGAAIGAIAGGGKGAAIGAAIGGGAGAGGVLATRGKHAELPAETRLSFRIASEVSVTERLK